MQAFRRSGFLRHVVLPLTLMAWLSGCYKWTVQSTPATLHEAPSRARITLSDGRVVELRSLEIRGDSVVGLEKTESNVYTSQTYALADVTKLEVRKDNRRMVNLIAGGVVLVGAVIAISQIDFCIIDPCGK